MAIIYDDFIGFSFNGTHSSEFGLKRVSDGSRYQEILIPTFVDYTEDIPGSDGTNYFGSNFKNRTIPISMAFDSLTDRKLRTLRQWLAQDMPKDIIFDELPYKRYIGKVEGEPEFKYICFNKGKERVYKGELNFNFICYYPWAKSIAGKKAFSDYTISGPRYPSSGTTISNDYPWGKPENWVWDASSGNGAEWYYSSGLRFVSPAFDATTYASGYSKSGPQRAQGVPHIADFNLFNPGDIDCDWKMTFGTTPGAQLQYKKFTFYYFTDTAETASTPTAHQYGSFTIGMDADGGILEQSLINLGGNIEIDTKTNMITFIKTNGTRIPALFLLKEGKLPKLRRSVGAHYYYDTTKFWNNNRINIYVSGPTNGVRPRVITAGTSSQDTTYETFIKFDYDYLYY